MKVYCNLPKQIKDKGRVFTYESALTSMAVHYHRHPERLANGKRYRVVHVLARNLRGKTNLHGRPYKPNQFLFTEK